MLNNSESITEEILLYFEKLYASPTGESWRVEGLDLYLKRVRLLLKKRFLRPFFSWIGIRRRGLIALPLQCFKIVGM